MGAGGATVQAGMPQMEDRMAWTKPRVTEVSLALEINGYVCADLV